MSTRRCEGPAFTECGAVTDLDRDTAPIPVQFHPERIGFIEDERVVRVIMRSEYVQRFARRENMTVHVALFARMKSGAKKFFQHFSPILHRLTTHPPVRSKTRRGELAPRTHSDRAICSAVKYPISQLRKGAWPPRSFTLSTINPQLPRETALVRQAQPAM